METKDSQQAQKTIQTQNQDSFLQKAALPLVTVFNNTPLSQLAPNWLLFASDQAFPIKTGSTEKNILHYPDFIAEELLNILFSRCLKAPNSLTADESYKNIPDIIHIKPTKSGITLDSIKELQQRKHYAPLVLTHYIVLISSCHLLNPNAANAFLKTLEEPINPTFFILSTHKKDLLLDTIQSRCLNYYIKPSPYKRDTLTDENKDTITPILFQEFLALSKVKQREWATKEISTKAYFEDVLLFWIRSIKDQLTSENKHHINLLVEKLSDLQYNINLSIQLEDFLIKITQNTVSSKS